MSHLACSAPFFCFSPFLAFFLDWRFQSVSPDRRSLSTAIPKRDHLGYDVLDYYVLCLDVFDSDVFSSPFQCSDRAIKITSHQAEPNSDKPISQIEYGEVAARSCLRRRKLDHLRLPDQASRLRTASAVITTLMEETTTLHRRNPLPNSHCPPY
ncbi:hypothetical protein Bca4012_026196 [Brassica carinata]|uniref:Uncharacterized protein n=1 Tax=Brassica carinata TaxID=52824 RepID=A0A8X7VIG4_BRACI|nr:hypothetical protein Bca52824_023278 [Brassica carinata]